MTLTIGPLTNFGLLFPVVCFCFCVWPSFTGAVLSMIKAYATGNVSDGAEYRLRMSVTSVNLGPERRLKEAQPRVFKLFLQPVAKCLQTKFQY